MPLEETRSKFIGLKPEQKELLILAELSGIQMDPAIYRILIELISLQIDPDAVFKLLKNIRRNSKLARQNSKQSVSTVRSNN